MTLSLDEQLASLRHGDHVCMLYADADEQIAATAPFIRDGLARDELCVYIADAATSDRFRARLASLGVDVAAATARERLAFLDGRATYLPGGSFSPDDMLGLLRESIDRAKARGFAGLRPTGDMSWALGGSPGCDRLIEYEAKLNDLVRTAPVVGICQYDRGRFAPRTVRDLLRTHPVAILDEQVCPNAFYEPPALVLGEEGDAQRTAWMMAQLRLARAAELALLQMNAELETVAYVAAHDLQEPLRLIRVYLDVLGRDFGDGLPPDAQRHIGIVQRSAARMSGLVAGILDYSRLDAGGASADVDLRRLVEEVVADLRTTIESARATVRVGALPTVRGEAESLRRLFHNLIGNALKFRRGPPAIRIDPVATRDDEHVIAVADDGIGIPEHLQPLLFRMFKRLHPEDAYPGHGIGLAACRKIVERHHGRIWLRSDVGVGSTFFVSLPR